MFHLTGDIHRM